AYTTAVIAAMPLTFDFNTKTGQIALKASVALADSDNDGHEEKDRDSKDSKEHNSKGHDSKDSKGHDDNGSDDDSNDHNGSDDNGADDNGSGDDSNDDNSTDARADGGNGASGALVAKYETSRNGIEVSFIDGSRIEIRNNRFERKDTAGRTIEERRATQADIDALTALR
ncbi:MAG: hypothetical protein U1D35_13900, partial [Paracoccaceae bacterium]|nr:hypothetical protein [Paracoccaceae bacterium]